MNNVLVEALTDGTPAYYNSNILGRYYRKDYFDFGNVTGTDANVITITWHGQCRLRQHQILWMNTVWQYQF